MRATLIRSLPLLTVALASTAGALSGCESSTPNSGADPLAVVDAGPATLEAPSRLSASTNLADFVRLAWAPPMERSGLTGYRVFRDGTVLAVVPPSESAFDDRTAAPATLLPPLLTASDGTRETGIELTWMPGGAEGSPAAHSYSVAAVYGTEDSAASAPALGSRAGIVTGYEVSQDGGPWIPVPDNALRFEDTNAPRARVTFVAPKVEDDYRRSAVRLEIPSHPDIGPMPTSSYRVRAVSLAAKGLPSLSETGRRATGRADRIRIQWQRSATPTDGAYFDIPGVTGRVWLDVSAPTDASRFFRARVDEAWAEGISVARSAIATNWKEVAYSGSDQYTCGIQSLDRKLRCWNRYGTDGSGNLSLPSSERYESVSVTGWSRCAIREGSHAVDCWEVPFYPMSSAGLVAHGGHRACALRDSDGSLQCVGLPVPGLDPAEAALPYDRIAISKDRVCAIRRADKRIQCWGGVWSMPAEPFVRVSVGDGHTCGIRASDGKLRCWGALDEGETLPGVSAPTSTSYVELDSRGNYLCAIRASDRRVECWGRPLAGYSNIAEAPAGRFASVSVGLDSSACGLREDGRMTCWFDPFVDEEFSSISLGGAYGCGLRKLDGKAVCWPNGAGGLDANESYRAVVTDGQTACALRASDGRAVCNPAFGGVPQTDPLDSISLAGHRACGVRSSDKRVVCWDGKPTNTEPQILPTDAFLSVTTVARHGCGIRASDQKVVCWGLNYGGEAPSSPSAIAFKQIVTHDAFTCGLRASDGLIDCWGDPQVLWSRQLPRVAYKSVVVSPNDLCAIRASDDRVVCSGGFGAGSLPSYDPVSTIAMAANGVCGLRASDGKLVCWGTNASGGMTRL